MMSLDNRVPRRRLIAKMNYFYQPYRNEKAVIAKSMSFVESKYKWIHTKDQLEILPDKNKDYMKK